MSAICPILRSSFDDYLADTLPAPQRHILREHLATCDDCRRAALEKDSTFAFASPFSPEPVEAADAARILASVRTGVALSRTERRLRRTGARRASGRKIAASIAAAAAGLALVLLTPGGGSARRVETAAARPAAAPVARELPAAQPLQLPLQVARPVEPAASSSEATIYDLNPGAGREEPRVVWIVDRGLDI